MIKILFACNYNSARSQMAEALLHKYGGESFSASSGGLDPRTIDPLVIQVLKEEEGIDISDHPTSSIFDYFKKGRLFHYVVTMCDDSNSERCPVFPGQTQRMHWSFKDPSTFTGTHEEKLERTKVVMHEIKAAVLELIESV